MNESTTPRKGQSGRIRYTTLLKVRTLFKRFGGITAIDDVSFDLDEGEIVGIMGPNGAGKTTLINLITGFERPDSGLIDFKGEEITGLKPHKISQKGIARTFQVVKPFHNLPLLGNVLISSLSDRSLKLSHARGWGSVVARALDLLEQVGFSRDEDPFKLARTLPSGHLRRLEIAKALATKPELLFLDEALSGLSHAETAGIIPLIRKLRGEGLTIAIVEHRVKELTRIVDRLIVLDRGKKIAEGAPEQVVRDKKVIEAYLGSEVPLLAES